jgi:GT2 family glycosyltransferase
MRVGARRGLCRIVAKTAVSPDTGVSVVLVTWRRPEHVRRCLASLARLPELPHEVLVVDASEDDLTADVVRDFPFVQRLPFRGGAGHMTTARNRGLAAATGTVVAFLDDDTEVSAGWLREVERRFSEDSTLVAACGRTCNGLPGEEENGREQVGRVFADGRLTGNFAVFSERPLPIQQGIGANMMFRRDALVGLGGLRDDFPGTALREDADVFLRITRNGGKALFLPEAGVDHHGAPHVKGRRFDYRYHFWATHNHALLLSRNFGLGSVVFRRWLRCAVRESLAQRGRNPVTTLPRILAPLVGLLAGLVTSARKASIRPLDPDQMRRGRRRPTLVPLERG